MTNKELATIIVKSLDRQALKKPKYFRHYGESDLYTCHTCKKILNNVNKYKYCPYCGQRLEW